ncbi:MAG: DUF971 domain-containing protein [Pseudomonadota bacterium]|nr:DUF971 domain-containing protein [Pseudomonadota bacterium]
MDVISHWPTELRLASGGKALKLVLDTHEEFEISAELLRVESPSAEVKGHGPGQEKLIYGKANVTITNLEPVGTYAIRLIFSDGHSTGIFTWDYLEKLGRQSDQLLQAYLDKLQTAGFSRQP